MPSLVRLLSIASLAALCAGCGGPVPLPPPDADASAIARDERDFVEAMKPVRAGRPVVAMLALNDGTEMTDLLLPHAVLERADVADVRVVAPQAGAIRLYPALQVDAEDDFAAFDRAHPAGADYVIVPAMDPDDDPAVVAWLREQADKGARIVGVCSGVRVVGRAGLLDGRRFAGHWYDRSTLLERHPGSTHVPHRRYAVDRGVATTTGITASVPTTLALVEALGGRARAQAVADELGVDGWTAAHDSTPFRLDASRRWAYVAEKIAFWHDESWRVDVHDGTDDIALALAVDAWTRTGRVDVAAAAAGPVILRSGLRLAAWPADEPARRVPLATALPPLRQLDRTLCEIAERFGPAARDRVLLEMEYPAAAACGARPG